MSRTNRNKLRRRMSPEELAIESQQRKARLDTRVKFLTITDDVIQDSPNFFEAPAFVNIHRHPEVSEFIHSFWKWNVEALPIMSDYAHPNINMQEVLAKMSAPYIGKVVVDLGCGAGDFYRRLFVYDDVDPKEIFGVDIDWAALAQMPNLLKGLGYRDKVALIQSSTMSKLPVWDGRADSVISSIGGIAYAGWWFDEDGKDPACEGKDALRCCLQDVHRVLKPGGHLAFSTLKFQPNFEAVLKDSLLWPLTHLRLKAFANIARHGFHIKNISQFLHKAEDEGHAQYLPLEDWLSILDEAGFEVIDYNYGNCYANQGAVFIARKR